MQIEVRVTPRSSKNKIEISSMGVKMWVMAAPTDGQANEAARRMLADRLRVAPSRIELIRGETSRIKVFRVEGNEEDLNERLRGDP